MICTVIYSNHVTLLFAHLKSEAAGPEAAIHESISLRLLFAIHSLIHSPTTDLVLLIATH